MGVKPGSTKRRGTPTTSGRPWVAGILGIEVPPPLRPAWGVAVLGNIAFAALWSFVGIWAIHVLGASPTIIGVMYAGDAAASALCGYYGGRLSDRVGRRGVLAGAWTVEALAAAALALVGHHVILGVGLVMLAGAASGPGLAATTALVADFGEASEPATVFGAFRVASNLGAMAGPAIGGGVLIGAHWPLFFGGIAALGLAAAGLAWWRIPSANPTPIKARTPGAGTPGPALWRDLPFVLLLGSTWGGSLVYVGFDVMLPLAAVQDYGLRPAVWGFLATVNPLMVVAFQGRLNRWIAPCRAEGVLLVSVMWMGASFLVLLVRHGVAFVLVSLVLFVVGEMVWSPAAQALAARLAADDRRGAYMGALGSAGSAAWVVGPLVDLRVAATGIGSVWVLLAVCGLGAGALGWLAARLGIRSP